MAARSPNVWLEKHSIEEKEKRGSQLLTLLYCEQIFQIIS